VSTILVFTNIVASWAYTNALNFIE